MCTLEQNCERKMCILGGRHMEIFVNIQAGSFKEVNRSQTADGWGRRRSWIWHMCPFLLLSTWLSVTKNPPTKKQTNQDWSSCLLLTFLRKSANPGGVTLLLFNSIFSRNQSAIDFFDFFSPDFLFTEHEKASLLASLLLRLSIKECLCHRKAFVKTTASLWVAL